MKIKLIFLLVLHIVAVEVNSSHIVFFHSVVSASHRLSIWPLAERLADVGHKVTYIFPIRNPHFETHPKVEELVPSKMMPILKDFLDFDINVRLNNTDLQWLAKSFSTAVSLCAAFYDSPEVKQWMSRPNQKIDLILIDSGFGECAYGLVHKFKAKHIILAPLMLDWLYDGYGVVPPSSSASGMLFPVKPTEMTLFNRVKNELIILLERAGMVYGMSIIEPVIKLKLKFTDMPPIAEFERNTSLVFVNNHFVEDYALPLPPMFVSVSGLSCGKGMKRNPLPKNLASFIEDAEGFVYVSLGSAVVASTMPASLRDKFFKGFSSQPKIKFFWRWTGDIPKNTPKNVMLHPWFPQKDILAHPKIKAFITQSGRPSTQEALCHGVPIIAIPMFGDQYYNAHRLEYIGAGIQLDIGNFTGNTFGNAIREILGNPKYKKRMEKLSLLFRDRPVDPVDNAQYWTEYVLRHDDTTLLKPLGMNQTWYERRFLDIYAMLLLVILVSVGIGTTLFVLTLKCLMRKLFGRKQKSD